MQAEAVLKFHILAFALGFVLDLLLGDPETFPHPVRLLGRMIAGLEKRLLGRGQLTDRQKLLRGLVLSAAVPLSASACCLALLWGGYCLHPCLGLLAETVMTYQLLSARCLKTESGKVAAALEKGSLARAREAVSRIVGRDVKELTTEEVIRAAVETVAENTSDGVIAPMVYTALGGPVLGFFYKAVNTMDSMIGYRNEKYLYFGRAAARLDDAANWIPARLSALLMLLAACLGGRKFSGKRAFVVYRRDRKKHASPNAAQTESVCAGALGIRLGGRASYFGIPVDKPFLGDDTRRAEPGDIGRANRLMLLTAWLGEILCLGCLLAAYGFLRIA